MIKKKILYLYSKMNPINLSDGTFFTGGAQKRIFQMAEFFQKNGYEVILGSDDKENAPIIDALIKIGVQHLEIPFKGKIIRKISGLFELILYVRENNVNIIHCNDRFSLLFGKIISLFSNVEMIYTARSIYKNKKFTRILMGEKIIAISYGVKENLEKFFAINRSKICVIYNGVDVKRPKLNEISKVKEDFGIKDNDRVIVTIGRLTTAKGLPSIFESIRILRNKNINVKLLVVGEGELEIELKKFVYKNRLEKSIVFCGFQESVEKFYSICEFSVLASIWEGLGGAAIESIMLGKPVIATYVGGLPEVIKNNVNGLLVPPNDPEALANSILYLLNNPDVAKNMGENGKRIANQKFTLKNMLLNYQKYYECLFPENFLV